MGFEFENEHVKELKLNLDSDTFADFKKDFGNILQTVLLKMEQKESHEATITAKMSIELVPSKKEVVGGPAKDIKVPHFKHKISSVMQIKGELTGSLIGQFELVWDKDLEEYIMREIKDPQINMEDFGDSIISEAENLLKRQDNEDEEGE